MPIFEIERDGVIFEVEGPTTPTEQDLEALYSEFQKTQQQDTLTGLNRAIAEQPDTASVPQLDEPVGTETLPEQAPSIQDTQIAAPPAPAVQGTTAQPIEEPTDIKPIVTEPEAPVERAEAPFGPISQINATSANLLAGATRLPGTIVQAFLSASNLLNKGINAVTGANLTTDAQVTPELRDNALTKVLDDIAEKDDYVRKEFGNKDFLDVLATKDVGQIAKFGGTHLLGQLPIFLLAGSGGGLATLGATTTSNKLDQSLDKLERGETLSDTESLYINALLDGTFEAAFEKIGSGKTINILKNAFKKIAKESGEEVAKQGFKESMSGIFKSMLGAGAREASEEAATTFSQLTTDLISGENTDLTFGEIARNSLNSMALGAVSGGALGGGGRIAVRTAEKIAPAAEVTQETAEITPETGAVTQETVVETQTDQADIADQEANIAELGQEVDNIVPGKAPTTQQESEQDLKNRDEAAKRAKKDFEDILGAPENVEDILDRGSRVSKIVEEEGVSPRVRKVVDNLVRNTRDGVMVDENNVGLQTRSSFDDSVQELLANRDKFGEFSVVTLDVSNLGGLNNAKGHEGANAILKDIMRGVVDPIVGEQGTMFRTGGDEVSIVLPGKTAEQSRSIMEQIDKAVDAKVKEIGLIEQPHPKHEGLPTGAGRLTLGVAQSQDFTEGDIKSDLLKKSDDMAKQDQIVKYTAIADKYGYIPLTQKDGNVKFVKEKRDGQGIGQEDRNRRIGDVRETGKTSRPRGEQEGGRGPTRPGKPTPKAKKPSAKEIKKDEAVLKDMAPPNKPPKPPELDTPVGQQGPNDASDATGIPDETVRQAFVRKVVDKYNRLKTVQKSVPEVTEETDVHLQQTLFSGRASDQLEQLEKKRVDPLMRDIVKSKVPVGDVELYLYAKHAPERNKHIKEIRPDMESGSGMTNEESEKILQGFKDKGQTETLEKIANQIYDINKAKLQLLKDAGLVSKKELSLWDRYDYYVPLKSEQVEAKAPRTGKGFDIRGKESFKAIGRKTAAENLIANAIADYEKTIVRAEKNKVGQTLLKLIRANPNPSLWTIDTQPMTPAFNENTGEVVIKKDPKYKLADNVLSVKEGGKDKLITIKDPLLARAMKNLGAEQSGIMIRGLGALNRFLSLVNTRLTPGFIGANFARDLQTALINVSAENSLALAKNIVKNIPSAMKASLKGDRGQPTGEWGKWNREFASEGGKIGFFGLDDINTLQKKLNKKLTQLKGGPKAKMTGVYRAAFGMVEKINDAIENTTRLSTYVALRKDGYSKRRAAAAAKNITVNFNQKGELGTLFNSMYLFANAGVQGTARLLRALNTKKGKAIASGIVVGSAAMAQLNRYVGGQDDDGEDKYDKISPFVKATNFIIMRPDGTFYKIPLPYGYNIFWTMGQAIGNVIDDGKPLENAAWIAGAAGDAFNPLGSAGSFIQTVAPTAIRPLVDLSMNRNFMGNPIRPEQPPFGPEKPESQLYFKTASESSRKIAEALNEVSGGSKFRAGKVDISPEAMDYVFDFFTGGAGRTVRQSADAIAKTLTGEEVPTRATPMLRRFKGEIPEFADMKIFYDNAKDVESALAEYEGLRDAKDKGADKFKKENMAKLQLAGSALTTLSSRIKAYRSQINASEIKGNKAQAKILNEKMMKLIRDFNKKYNQRVKGK